MRVAVKELTRLIATMPPEHIPVILQCLCDESAAAPKAVARRVAFALARRLAHRAPRPSPPSPPASSVPVNDRPSSRTPTTSPSARARSAPASLARPDHRPPLPRPPSSSLAPSSPITRRSSASSRFSSTSAPFALPPSHLRGGGGRAPVQGPGRGRRRRVRRRAGHPRGVRRAHARQHPPRRLSGVRRDRPALHPPGVGGSPRDQRQGGAASRTRALARAPAGAAPDAAAPARAPGALLVPGRRPGERRPEAGADARRPELPSEGGAAGCADRVDVVRRVPAPLALRSPRSSASRGPLRCRGGPAARVRDVPGASRRAAEPTRVRLRTRNKAPGVFSTALGSPDWPVGRSSRGGGGGACTRAAPRGRGVGDARARGRLRRDRPAVCAERSGPPRPRRPARDVVVAAPLAAADALRKYEEEMRPTHDVAAWRAWVREEVGEWIASVGEERESSTSSGSRGAPGTRRARGRGRSRAQGPARGERAARRRTAARAPEVSARRLRRVPGGERRARRGGGRLEAGPGEAAAGDGEGAEPAAGRTSPASAGAPGRRRSDASCALARATPRGERATPR